jgi:quinol monooxygenase YgiN
MIVLMGIIQAPPDAIDRLRTPMAAVVAASLAEDGCVEYAYGQDMLEPGLIRASEVWRDREALDRHLKTPHMDAWRAARAELGVGPHRFFLYQASEPERIG